VPWGCIGEDVAGGLLEATAEQGHLEGQVGQAAGFGGGAESSIPVGSAKCVAMMATPTLVPPPGGGPVRGRGSPGRRPARGAGPWGGRRGVPGSTPRSRPAPPPGTPPPGPPAGPENSARPGPGPGSPSARCSWRGVWGSWPLSGRSAVPPHLAKTGQCVSGA
jgi:hypothetical protein